MPLAERNPLSTAHAATSQHHADAKLIWDYHQLGHQLRPCSAGIGLGSHDLGVATLAAGLYLAGLFPVLVFSGGNSPTTADVFPRGEAVHYAEHAISLGVPAGAIIIEPRAANTGQNIDYSRQALADAGIPVTSVMLISKPYMQRRAYATIRKAWPEAEPVCASEDITFDEYLKSIGDDKLVIDMLVGDLQRIIDLPRTRVRHRPGRPRRRHGRLPAADRRRVRQPPHEGVISHGRNCCAPSTSPTSCPACPPSPSSTPPTSGSSSTTSSSPAATTSTAATSPQSLTPASPDGG